MVERKEVPREVVQTILAMATEGGPVPVPPPILAALCRAWLAVQDAPTRMVGDGISYGVSVAGTGIVNGQRVRIVKEVGDD